MSRVKIAGVRMFADLELEVPVPPSPDKGQWIVILGENGAGKTTLLRSVALALAESGTAVYAWTPIDEVHRFIEGVEKGVWVTANDRDYSFNTVPGTRRPILELPPERPHLPVFAYGAARGNGHNLTHGADDIRPVDALGTLFEPRGSGLVSTVAWLRKVALDASGPNAPPAKVAFFESVKAAVASFLPGGECIELDGAEVYLRSPSGHRFPLAAHGEGYLTTIGWTIDLIARWAEMFRDGRMIDGAFNLDMPCVVLVDELDLHLHPRWQLEIIPRLRAAFPKTTFIVSTHNPLTLQGARPGEVFVLQRDEAGAVSIVARDVPHGIDANRLLTGDWFGLASTLDEDTLRLLDDHRALLWAKRPEDDPERLDLEAQIRQRLGRFADTSLERLAQSVSVEVLHRDSAKRPRDVTEAQREEIIKKVEARLVERDRSSAVREAGKPYRPRVARIVQPKAAGRVKPSKTGRTAGRSKR